MALTYYLKFTRNLEEKPELKKMIENHDNKFFTISDLYSPTFPYVESYFDDYEINLDLGSASEIMFRVLKKDAEPISFRKSILKLVHKITEEIYPKEDYFFDFNGDLVHEKRENGVVKRNSNTDFYDDLD
jgi:hypothetical protein